MSRIGVCERQNCVFVGLAGHCDNLINCIRENDVHAVCTLCANCQCVCRCYCLWLVVPTKSYDNEDIDYQCEQ